MHCRNNIFYRKNKKNKVTTYIKQNPAYTSKTPEKIRKESGMFKEIRDEENKDSTKIVLQVDNKEDEDSQIDLLNVAGQMGKKKKLYAYCMAAALCIGVLVGLIIISMQYITGKGSYAQAMVSFQYDGIEEGLDPNGAAFDINKIKSPAVITDALETLGITDVSVEDIRQNIAIEGVIPEDAVERITTIKQMAEEDASNYEKILDVTYFPSQYVVYLYKCKGVSGTKTAEILEAILDSYREYFMDTYANTEVLTVTSNLIDYTQYDYAESVDMIESQIDIMLDYVTERRDQAPDFRSSATGLSFGDIKKSLETIQSVDLAKLTSYVESHNLTKDQQRQREYYEYKIKKCNMDLSELQVQLSNVQNTIDNYQKDPVVIVSSQESTQEITQADEYYDTLLDNKLTLSKQISEVNTELNETYSLLNAMNTVNSKNAQSEYDYVDSVLSKLAETLSVWVKQIEDTTDEYYNTTLFSNAYKISVPAKYKAAGGIMDMAVKIVICAAVAVFVVVVIWCIDGLKTEISETRKRAKKIE